MRTPEEIRAKLDEMMAWPTPNDYFKGSLDGWGNALIWVLNEEELDEPAARARASKPMLGICPADCRANLDNCVVCEDGDRYEADGLGGERA